MSKKQTVETPLLNKNLPKRDKVTIRFNSDEHQSIAYDFDRFIEQQVLNHAASGKKTPKPKTNDYYAQALIRGMQYDLFENKTDEIANIAAKAVKKVLMEQNNEIKVRQNIQLKEIGSKMEYMEMMFNYMIPFVQSLNSNLYEATIDEETASIKPTSLLTPLGFESLASDIKNKWHNKIKKDSTVESIINNLEKGEK